MDAKYPEFFRRYVIFRLCKVGVFADDRYQVKRLSICLMSTQRVACDGLSRSARLGERCAPVLLAVLLMRAGCVLAEEPAADTRGSERERSVRSPVPSFPANEAAPPARWSAAEVVASEVAPRFQLPSNYSPREYRALGPGSAPRETVAISGDARPALKATSAWGRLEDYKTRGGIRLLTLWKSKFSALSIQTGHGGIPTLQWTSRGGLGGGAGTTQGVLDRLLSSGIDRLEVIKHGMHPLVPPIPDRPADRRDN